MIDGYTMQILIGIGKGLVFGAIAGGLGYIKNETWESFDPYKFTKVLIIGGVVGGIAGTGTSLSEASAIIGTEFGFPAEVVEAFIMTGIVSLANYVVKIIARRTDLGKLWDAIKAIFNRKFGTNL